MQNNIFTFLILIAATLSITAQITVTNSTFPAAGDTLRTATDQDPTGITITPAGGPQVWDFSSLNSGNRQMTTFQPAADGSAAASYPAAELVTINDVGGEIYYDVSPTVFSILGLSGAGFGVGLPFETDFKYAPPLIERQAPLNFLSNSNTTANATITIAASDIPPAFYDSLDIPTGLFDSVRVRLTINRFDLVDGYGMITIPGGTYDVLRQKRTDITAAGIEVRTFLGWVDVSTIIGMDLFPTDTTITYNFISNTGKEPIAVVTVDSSGIDAAQVEFKDNGIPNAINPISGKTISVANSPNPVTDQAVFELTNILPGRHTLRMFDANGKNVLVHVFTTEREIVSLEALNEGIYFYNVINERGEVLGSGRVVKKGF